MLSSEMECVIMVGLSVVYFGSLFIAYLKYLENRQLEKEILEIDRDINTKKRVLEQLKNLTE